MALKVPRWVKFKERITGDNEVSGQTDEGIANRPLRDLYDNQVSINNGLGQHVNNKSNPHAVTKAQVGLSNVQNFTASDATNDSSTTKYALISGVKKAYDKAVSVLNDLTSHKNNKSNPHGVTADQLQAVKRSGDTMSGNLKTPSITFNSDSSDSASIRTTLSSSSTYLDFKLEDDPAGNDKFRWMFDVTGDTEDRVNMELYPTSAGANKACLKIFGEAYLVDGNKRIFHEGHHPTPSEVGLSQVNNWPATSAVNDSSSSKYATALGVKTAYDKAVAGQGTANNAVMKAGDTMTGDLNFPAVGNAHYDVGRCDHGKTNTEKQAIRFSNDGSVSVGADKGKNASAKVYIRPEGVNSGSNIHSFSATGLAITGQVSTSGSAPTAESHLTRKDYVDGQIGLKVSKAGDTMTGDLILDGSGSQLFVARQHNTTSPPSIDLAIGDSDTGFNWVSDGLMEGWVNNTKVFEWSSGSFKCTPNMYVNTNQRVFADNYHPNADKLTTARSLTVTLSGDVSGSNTQTFDGTVNKTFTIPVTVADNSHSHSYVPLAGGTMTGDLILTGSGSQLFVAHQYGNVSPPSIDLAIGDSDTGFNWVSNSNIQGFSNNTVVFQWTPDKFQVEKNLTCREGLSTVKGIACGTNMSIGGNTTCSGRVTINNDLLIKQGTIRYNTEERSMEFIV